MTWIELELSPSVSHMRWSGRVWVNTAYIECIYDLDEGNCRAVMHHEEDGYWDVAGTAAELIARIRAAQPESAA